MIRKIQLIYSSWGEAELKSITHRILLPDPTRLPTKKDPSHTYPRRTPHLINNKHPHNIPITKMSKFLRGSREQLKRRILGKLSLSTNEEEVGLGRDSLQRSSSQEHLDKMMRDTEKKKLSIRKLIASNSPHADLSDQMAHLRSRIDVLRNFSRNEKEKLIGGQRGTSLTGKEEGPPRELTFDELYELQKRKFAALRQRRSKAGDQKYVEMVGNMQLRKEKRKTLAKDKVEDQMRILNEKIEERIE